MVLIEIILKKNLLIFWGGRELAEVIEPNLKELSNNYNIYLILHDYHAPPNFRERINLYYDKKIIKSFYIISPNMNDLLKVGFFKLFLCHRSLCQKLKKFININFDYYLTSNTTETIST